MKVAVNALALPSFRQGGAGYYTATLIAGLSDHREVETEVLVSPSIQEELRCFAPTAVARLVKQVRRSPAYKIPNYLLAYRYPDRLDLGFNDAQMPSADVVHWPISFLHGPPAAAGVRRVLTVLDLQQEFFPSFFSPRDRALRRLRWAPSARSADHIIAISEFTRTTLCNRYGVAPERITTVPLACRRVFLPVTKVTKDDLPPPPIEEGKWFLYPASPLPAKNHVRLLDAFSLHLRDVDPDARLVLIGPRLHSWAPVSTAITERRLERSVMTLGHVDETALRNLYVHCTGLIFPSLFEGFGLPVLEAMASGCPVATSSAGSLPELVGDAGHMFPPDDTRAIAEALAWLSSLEGEARATVVASGTRRAKDFSPEKMVERTISVYRALVS